MNLRHDCSEEIKNASLKVTPARIAAMKLFESHNTPMDAQHLIDHLHKTLGIDRVTGFRILNTFVEKGLITKVEFGEGKARYEAASKGDHHHLICESCGRVEDIEDTMLPGVIDDISQKHNFLVKSHAMEFFGLCKDCQK